jgi:peptidoglycan-associated lipoprotein
MRRSLFLIIILTVLSLTFFGCPKKTPPPPPMPIVEPEPEPEPEPDNAKQLIDRPTTSIRLQGHCDDRGTEQYNLALGQKRAESVKQFLINYGITASRLETISYGEEKPVCSIKSKDCWDRNRRVEFIIISE